MAKTKVTRGRNKILLPNDCWCSMPNISPQNWNTAKASTKKEWSIRYRFYDPKILDANGNIKPKPVQIKGMNEYKDLELRRRVASELLRNEIDKLKFKGFNPVVGDFIPEMKDLGEVNQFTPFITALKWAYKKLEDESNIIAEKDREKRTKTILDVKSVVKGIEKAANHFGIQDRNIADVTRKYFVAMFEYLEKVNARFTPARCNKYRDYLIKLYKKLIAWEAVEIIPLRDIEKKRVIKRKRKTLTQKERVAIDDYLHKHHYSYWRFMHIFFASGARITEIMRLKGKDIDIANQRFYSLSLKGASPKEVMHTIKDNVVHLWKEALLNCRPYEYIFGYNLAPGDKFINPDTINKKWRKWVKRSTDPEIAKLKIEADFYSLKHTHTSQISKLSGEDIAAGHDGHTTTAMVRSIYNFDRDEQVHAAVKGLPNTLTGS